MMADQAIVTRLFVYGSLQPGGPNEHVLAETGGDWQPGVISDPPVCITIASGVNFEAERPRRERGVPES